jgi:hypothetical protein
VAVSEAPPHSVIAARFGQLRDAITELFALGAEEDWQKARNLVLQRIPKFVYYSNYGNLDSEIYLPHVIDILKRSDLGPKEQGKARTLKVLFDFVGLKPEEIQELGKDDVVLASGAKPTPDQENQSPEVPPIIRRSLALSEGHWRRDGKWMAGLHYNSALVRLSAIHHRSLQMVVGTKRPRRRKKRLELSDLRRKASAFVSGTTGKGWSCSNIAIVHKEVNNLKHREYGTWTGRTVPFVPGAACCPGDSGPDRGMGESPATQRAAALRTPGLSKANPQRSRLGTPA